MGEAKKISIVLPVYNGERYLPFALDSIMQQEYQNWELIIVNDCSTDGTPAIIAAYAERDGRIRAHHNQTNLQLPRSLNAGFALASGDYYTWTSDDNILRPNMLSTLAAVLDEAPEVGMVYSGYSFIDENGELQERWDVRPTEQMLYDSIVGASFLYRREVAQRVGEYDPDTFLAEDFDYWIRMYCGTTVRCIPDDLYLYRRHGGSLSVTKLERMLRQTCYVLKKNFFMISEKLPDEKTRWLFYDRIISLEAPEKRDATRRTLERDTAYRIRMSARRGARDCKNIVKRMIGRQDG